MSNMVLHRGGELISREQLQEINTPPPEGRWYPLSHSVVLNSIEQRLQSSGYEITKASLAVSCFNARFFGVLDLSSKLGDGVTLAVGIRNSFDKSFPMSFCAGSRVFVCDNLAFNAELLVSRRHTMNAQKRFGSDVDEAMTKLIKYREAEECRIIAMRKTEVNLYKADSIILRSYMDGIINSHVLPDVVNQWRNPGHAEFMPRNYWSLLNAFTGALSDRFKVNPAAAAVLTMKLNALFFQSP